MRKKKRNFWSDWRDILVQLYQQGKLDDVKTEDDTITFEQAVSKIEETGYIVEIDVEVYKNLLKRNKIPKF